MLIQAYDGDGIRVAQKATMKGMKGGMESIVKFQSAAVPIYLEVMCPECGPAREYQSGHRPRPSLRSVVIANNEIGQAVRCPSCNTKLVVTTEAVVVKLLEGEGEEKIN